MAQPTESVGEMMTLFSEAANQSGLSTGGPRRLAPIVHPDIPMVRFVCEVIVSFPVAALGILGNIASFVVLCRQKKRITTNVLLQALAVADTLILISSILLRSMRYVGWPAYDGVYQYVFVSLYPCVYFFRLADTWITVVMTIDRYIAVCYPLHAQRLCTLRRTYVIVGVILLSTFVFSVPRFFEFRLIDDKNFDPTELVKSRTYTILYRMALFFLVMYLVPTTLLTVLNIRLLSTLRGEYRKWDGVTSGGRARRLASDTSYTGRTSRSVTLIVVTIVVICIVGNVVTMAAQVLWVLHMCFEQLRHLEAKRRFLANVSNILVTFNSAVNFVVYCLFSRQFRVILKQTLRCRSRAPTGVRHRWRSRTQRIDAKDASYLGISLPDRLPYKPRGLYVQ